MSDPPPRIGATALGSESAIEPVVGFRYGPTLEIGAASPGSGGDSADPLASIGDLTWAILASSSFETPAWLALGNGLPWDTDFREGAELLGAEGLDPSLRPTGESARLVDPAHPPVSDHANASEDATQAAALAPTPSSVIPSQRAASAQHLHEAALSTPAEPDQKPSDSLGLESEAGQSKPRDGGVGPPQSSQRTGSEPPHPDHTYNVSATVEVGANNLTAPSPAEASAAAPVQRQQGLQPAATSATRPASASAPPPDISGIESARGEGAFGNASDRTLASAAPSTNIDPFVAPPEADKSPPAAGLQAPPVGATAQSPRSQPGEAVAATVSPSAPPGDRTLSALRSETGPFSSEETLERTTGRLPIVPATAKSSGPPPPAIVAASPPARSDHDARVSALLDRPPSPIVAEDRTPHVSRSSAYARGVGQGSAVLPSVPPAAHVSDSSNLSMSRPTVGEADDAIGAKSRPLDASPIGDTARDSARATVIVPYESEMSNRSSRPVALSAPHRHAAAPVSDGIAQTFESSRQPQRQHDRAASSFDMAQASLARPYNVKPGHVASASEPPAESGTPVSTIDDQRSAQSVIVPAESPKISGARQISPSSAEHQIQPEARSPRSQRSHAVADSNALASATPSKAVQTMLDRPQLRSDGAADNGLRAERAAAEERIAPPIAGVARPRQRAANAMSAIDATHTIAKEMPATPVTAGAATVASAASVVVPNAAPSKPSAMPRREEGEAAPIRISIGRISVESASPPPPKHAARARPKMSLGDYLKRRRD